MKRFGADGTLPVKVNVINGLVKSNLELRYPSDFTACMEIYSELEYELGETVGKCETIVDLGANSGISTNFLRDRYQSKIIVAVEANPVVFGHLTRRFKNMPDVIAENVAIAPHDGSLSFYVGGRSSLSSSRLSRDDIEQQKIDMPCLALDSLCSKHGIKSVDLVKFDIEGSEYDSIHLSEVAQKANYLVGEVHPDLVADATLDDFLKLFPNHHWRIHEVDSIRFVVHGFLRSPEKN